MTDNPGWLRHPNTPPNDYPELRDLRYFVATAEELHFTRAAQRLHIAQQVLSAAIRQLEVRLGVSLFERTTRSVRLTPAGEAMLPRARHALRAAAEAAAVARDVGRGITGRVTIGVSHSAHRFGAPILRAMRQRVGCLDVEVCADYVQPLVDALVAHHLDAAILHCPERRGDLAYQRLSDQPTVIVMHPDHHLAGREMLHASELSEEIVVLAPSSVSRGYNLAVLGLLQREGVAVRTAESPPYLEPIGFAPNQVLAIISEIALDAIPSEVELVRVQLKGHTLPFDLVWHRESHSPWVDTLRSVAADVARAAAWPCGGD
jgi:DNA-binding transcriptional LysR family regulator